MKILVTGGLGYIGAHVVCELLTAGYEVEIVDNLQNSTAKTLLEIQSLTGKKPRFHHLDIRNGPAVAQVIGRSAFSGAIHLAGLKSVPESCSHPLQYYSANVGGSMSLLAAMKTAHMPMNVVFSSSAAVYGAYAKKNVTEMSLTRPQNPYGTTKLTVEGMLADLAKADSNAHLVSLRYFNPVGAHSSRLLGEDIRKPMGNLVPNLCAAAYGHRTHASVYGNDHKSPDGTGVRDYIHVVDLAKAHVSALEYVMKSPGHEVFNLGTGAGYSVLEMVNALSEIIGSNVPVKIEARRPGDVAEIYADVSKAKKMLGWEAKKSLQQMLKDHWAAYRYQVLQPKGTSPIMYLNSDLSEQNCKFV